MVNDIKTVMKNYMDKSDHFLFMEEGCICGLDELQKLFFMFGDDSISFSLLDKYRYRLLYTERSFIVVNKSKETLVSAHVNYNSYPREAFWDITFKYCTSDFLEKILLEFVVNISEFNVGRFNGMILYEEIEFNIENGKLYK